MDQPAPIASLTVPLGGQRIEMHPVAFEAGGLPLLRVRIREGKRFTVLPTHDRIHLISNTVVLRRPLHTIP